LLFEKLDISHKDQFCLLLADTKSMQFHYCSASFSVSGIDKKYIIMDARIWVWLLILVVDYVSSLSNHVYTNEFAVEIDGDVTVADLVASTHNMRLVRQVR
jgi:hypothetical protein